MRMLVKCEPALKASCSNVFRSHLINFSVFGEQFIENGSDHGPNLYNTAAFPNFSGVAWTKN